MKLGVNTLIWTGGFTLDHLPLLNEVKRHGFDGIEIATFQFQDFPARRIGEAVKEAGLECVLCSAFTGDLSFASEDAGVRARARSFLESGIRAAAALGADTFAGPYCTPVGLLTGERRTAAEWERVVEELRSVTPVLEECGVTLCLEPLNRFEAYFLNTAADARSLCEEINHPLVGVLFDTFHANIEEKSAPEAIRLLGPWLKHVHSCENDRGVPGSGHVPWDGVFEALRDIHYHRWVVIESFGFAIKDIARAACIWRDIAPSPEIIAWEGGRFLRNYLTD